MEFKEPEDQNPPGFPVHPFAQAMPEMQESEFTLFKEDIGQNGLLRPIEILDGMVLDGRHRQRACIELGIEPAYVVLKKEDVNPLAHVLSSNRFLRHANKSQMAVAAVRIYLLSHGLTWSGIQETANVSPDFAQVQNSSLTQDETSRMFGVSKRLFSQAMKLYESGSDASESLRLSAEQGLVMVGDASKIVDEPGEVQDAAVELALRGQARTVSAAVSRVHRERDQAAVPEAPHLESWQSADGSITLHHRAMQDLRELVPPESIDVIITGVPGGDGASLTLRELGSFAVHALKPDGVMLLLCQVSRLPGPFRDIRQRNLDYITEIDFRFDVPVGKLDERHQVGIRRMPLLVYGKPGFVLADGDDIIQLPAVKGDSADVKMGQRLAVGTSMIVRRFTQPGDMVSDPILLSWSYAALAAFRLGRRFLGSSHDGGRFQRVRDHLIHEDERRITAATETGR